MSYVEMVLSVVGTGFALALVIMLIERIAARAPARCDPFAIPKLPPREMAYCGNCNSTYPAEYWHQCAPRQLKARRKP